MPSTFDIAPQSNVKRMELSSLNSSAMLLHVARAERTLSDLACVLETSWPAAKRLENPTHWRSLKTLYRTAAALGKRLVLTLE